MATKKLETSSIKPDFRKGDRVSGIISSRVYKKSHRAKMMTYRQMDAELRDFNGMRGVPDRYYGEPHMADGYEAEIHTRANEEFYEVKVPPYKVDKSWYMTVTQEGSNEQEVDCKDFHLVGERIEVEPLLSKEEKEKLMKLTKPAVVTLIVVGVIAIIGLWLGGNYNDLVRAQNSVSNSRAKIDTELTRRYDLIDNIVASVQGSQAQESDVLGKIAEARKIGGSSTDAGTQAEANNTIDTQIALLPRLQEAYPELRSNDQVTRLITELQGTNGIIRDKRNEYNDTVTNYNNNITSFPKNIFAGIFNFNKEKLFEASKEERVNPKVDLKREN